MRVLGLTGGIATGKSTVAKLLLQDANRRGWRPLHVDADQIAREIVLPGSAGLTAVVAQFGAEMVHPPEHAQAGSLNRAKLGALVFADPAARLVLEGLLHPLIRDRIAETLADGRSQGVPVAVLDAALLFEMGLQAACELSLVIWCPQELQRSRLVERDGLSLQAAQGRLDAQWSHDQRLALADLVLPSDQPLAAMPAAVASLLDELRERWPELP
jgi:dephospho-CoA kinase